MAIGTAAALVGSAVVGAAGSAIAGKKAAKAQKGAANAAAANEQAMFEAQREDNEKNYAKGRRDLLELGYDPAIQGLQPYSALGVPAQNRLAALSGLNGSTALTSALQQDPGYQFRMDQGVNALDRSAASRGMMQSGAQQKALTRYGQGIASEELGNAYNRVAGVQNSGQQAAGAIANLYGQRGSALGNLAQGHGSQNQQLSMNTSNALGQYSMASGNAQAAGYQNMGSSVNAGIQNGLTAYMMNKQNQGGMYGNNRGSIGGTPYNGPR